MSRLRPQRSDFHERAQKTLPFAIGLYLTALPFLPPQPAALALMCLTGIFAVTELQSTEKSFAFMLPVLPFLASSLLAVSRAAAPDVAAGFFSFQLPGLILFVILVRGHFISARSWMWLWTLFLLVTAISVVAGWLRWRLGGADLTFDEDVPQAALRLSGNMLLAVPNDSCIVGILSAFPLGLLATGAGTGGPGRWLAGASVGCAVLALSIVRSRTGLAIEGAECLLACLVRPRLLLWLIPLCLLAGLVDRGFGLLSLQKFMLSDAHDLHGIAGRLGLWVAAWRLFEQSPLIGGGALSFGLLHWPYMPAWAPRFPEGRVMWSHSLFLDILAEQGLAGIVAFAITLFAPVRQAARAARHAAPEMRGHALCALYAIGGFLLAGAVELSLIRRWVPLVMFGLLGFALKTAAPQTASCNRTVM